MSIYYGGIYMRDPTPSIAAAIESSIPARDIYEFRERNWPGTPEHQSIPLADLPPIELNRLYWPQGASKFAVCHVAASDANLMALRALAYPGGAAYNSLELVFNDGVSPSVSTQMFMLPPRPLFQHPKKAPWESQLYLLTLVDVRYFWWEHSVQLSITENTTTWANVIDACFTAIGATPESYTVNSAYLKPSGLLAGRHNRIPLLLDTILYSVGLRLARKLNGKIYLQTPDEAKQDENVQWGRRLPIASGGRFHLSAELPTDLQAKLPSSIDILFPRVDDGAVDDSSPYIVNKTLASLNIGLNVTGRSEQPLIKTTLVATSTGGGTPSNSTELGAFATQFAKDWYKWQLGRMDTTFAGVVDYEPHALADKIIWRSGCGRNCLTRVMRGENPYEIDSIPGTSSEGSVDSCCPHIYNTPDGIATDVPLHVRPNVSYVLEQSFTVEPPPGQVANPVEIRAPGTTDLTLQLTPNGNLLLAPQTSSTLGLVVNTPASNTALQLAVTQPNSPSDYAYSLTPTPTTLTELFTGPNANPPTNELAITNTTLNQTFTGPGTINRPNLLVGLTSTDSSLTLTGGVANPPIGVFAATPTDISLNFTGPGSADQPQHGITITGSQAQEQMLGVGPNPPNQNNIATSTAITLQSTGPGSNAPYKLTTIDANGATDEMVGPGSANQPTFTGLVDDTQSKLLLEGVGPNEGSISQVVNDTLTNVTLTPPGSGATGKIITEVDGDYAQEKITAGNSQDRPLWLLEESDGTDKVWVDDGFQMHAKASDTTSASLNLGPGTAPTSPANGDIWVTSASIFARVNGTTYDLLTGSAAPGGSDTYVQFNDSGSFGGDAGLTYDKTTDTLVVTDGGSGDTATISGGALTLIGSGGTLNLATGATVQISSADAVVQITGGSTNGLKVGIATGDLLGFWGASPVAQYSTTGTTTGFTAGSGTPANDDSTYTGNTGSTAYTTGDIVKALKLAGIMAQ